jgi:predicted secreted protein with PEFG-CTERM motif
VTDGEEADYTEKITSDSRVLSISFPEGTSEITIYGTRSVPEFPIAALILVASITVTLIVTRTKWNQ